MANYLLEWEHFGEKFEYHFCFEQSKISFNSKSYQLESMVEDIFRSLNYRTDRKEPQPIECVVYEITAKNGKQVKSSPKNFRISLPLAELTPADFEEEMTKAVSKLPIPFQNWVRSKSYEDGHSSGYEEVLNIAQGLASDLVDVIQQYERTK